MTEPVPPPVDGLFRSEAMHHCRWRGATGEVLRSTPGAIRHAHNVVMAVVLVALAFGLFGKVHRYSTGPMVIRVTGRTELTALGAGTVAEVRVIPLQRVKRGELLVRF